MVTVLGPITSILAHPQGSVAVKKLEKDIDHLSYRLPKVVVPIAYDLWLYTRLGVNDFGYQGRVNITLKVTERTDAIVLHNDGLDIKEERLWPRQRSGEQTGSVAFPILGRGSDKERQFYIVKFAVQLEPGVYILEIHFDGEVRDDVFGFYRSSHVDNNETKWMGVTQFSPTFARRAFPCMDEPHLKAVFTLHVGHSGNQMVTSNTGAESSVKRSFRNDSNYYITTFLPTPRMSTYLVGWAVHDFVPATSVSSPDFKMWTRRSMSQRGSIALNQGTSIYSFLNGWLLVDNPIPKMDQVAVVDFNFHAMENWGMITFRESVVLYEDGVTPTKSMFDGFTTMAHEYAHTWFGNLVTPMFWNVAWLKEGFASYFQYFAVSSVQPTWQVMDKFVVDMLQPTLLLDSVNHTRVMNDNSIGSPSSIMAALDFVSYKKGASVIRMLSHVIGDPAFQYGLQSYLKNMSYKAASPSDLYEHLQIYSDKIGHLRSDILIKDMMESWTSQPGFPLVTVTRNYKEGTLTVSREPFRQSRNQSATEHKASGWYIPLNSATESSITDFARTSGRHWLKPGDRNLTIDFFSSKDWVIFNVQQVGYYRVNYDERNWHMLVNYLRSEDFEKIHKVNRASLIDDAFNLARAGYIHYSIPFELSSYLIQEADYEPWVAATNNFKFLSKALSSVSDVHRAFQEHALRLLEPMYKQLSFNESPHEGFTTKLLRQIVLSTSCLVRNAHCLRTSETLFHKWISTPDERVPQDVKSFVYCEGIRNGDEKAWHTVLTRWLFYTDLQTEQELLAQALGCTRRANLIDKYLGLSISEEHNVRKQYRIAIVDAVLNGDGRNVERVMDFVRDNLQRIVSSRGYEFLGKMLGGIGNAITTEEQAEKLRSLVGEKVDGLGAALNAAKQAIVVSSANVEWVKKYSPIIADCFN